MSDRDDSMKDDEDGFLRIAFETNPSGIVWELGQRISGFRSIEVDNAFYIEDGEWLESITIASVNTIDIDAVCRHISGISLVHHKSVPTGPTDTDIHRIVLRANESYPYILEQLLIHQTIPNRVVLKQDYISAVVTTHTWDEFRDVADDIEEKFGAFELVSVDQIQEPGEPLDTGHLSEVIVTKLSDTQIETIETAYELGYFDVPRSISAKALAEELEVSQATVSERLRRAESKLFELIFGAK